MTRTRLTVAALALGAATVLVASTAHAVADRNETPTTATRPHVKAVHCGTDRWGGVYAKIPASWAKVTHSRLRCRWTSPDGTASIVLQVRAPHLKAQRARVSGGAGYVEYAYKHGSLWGGTAVKWGYAEGVGQSRVRHTVLQEYRSRLAYLAKVGHYGDHLDQFRAAVSSSGAAG